MPNPNAIRAEIYGRRMTARIKRRGWARNESWMHWHLIVTAGKKVLVTDDCRDLAMLHETATRHVFAFRHLASIGHKFRSWGELLDDAERN